MRIKGPGASISRPRVTLLSDDMPAYEEQAILTPDMRTVIMMSNRSHTTPESWANLIVAAAQRTTYDAPNTGSTQTIQFLADFIPPTHFNSDLYAVDVGTKAIRQLTNFPRGVIPEFFWNRDYTKILFFLHADTRRDIGASYVAQFPGAPAAWRKVPSRTPAALAGKPVNMARVGAQAQKVRDPGPTDNVAVAVKPPADPAPAEPVGAPKNDKPQVPVAAATYTGLWLADLGEILRRSGSSFTTPPLISGVGQFGGG
jgi:hypothetical protein